MPTVLTHPIVPIAIALAAGSKLVSPRLMIAGAIGSILPDLDVLAFHFGIPYGHELGHRGLTHSLCFAAVVGLLGMLFAKQLRSTNLRVLLFLFIATASHAVLDAFTNGGLGVAAFWPFSSERFFAPFRVIEVSPIGISRFLTERGVSVLKSEAIWIWAPSLIVAAVCIMARYGLAFIVHCDKGVGMTGEVTGGVRWILRLEGLAVFCAALLAYSQYGNGWATFLIYFLVPDISFLGYVAGPKIGAVAYNCAHSYIGAVACLSAGVFFSVPVLVTIGLIWCAHIGFDRVLGYGLKYQTGFGFTHFGRIGKRA